MMSADTLTKAAPNPRHATKKPSAMADLNLDGLKDVTSAFKITPESIKQSQERAFALCSDSVATYLETGSAAAKMVGDMTKSYMESYNAFLVCMAEIGREAAMCRSPQEFADLNKKALEAIGSSVLESGRAYGNAYASFSKSFEPVLETSPQLPERVFGVLAD